MPKTHEEIVHRLGRERSKLVDRYRSMSGEDLVRACTKSEDPDGAPWSPKDHLAHLLRIEEAFLAMAKRTVGGDEAPMGRRASTPGDAIAAVHRDNERHVEGLREKSLDELLADLDSARAATLAFLNGASAEQLAMPIPGAPWGDGTVGGVLLTNAYHERQHLAWADEGLTASS